MQGTSFKSCPCYEYFHTVNNRAPIHGAAGVYQALSNIPALWQTASITERSLYSS